jgi:uncharacterized membrane protein YebE (DUF533 family)
MRQLIDAIEFPNSHPIGRHNAIEKFNGDHFSASCPIRLGDMCIIKTNAHSRMRFATRRSLAMIDMNRLLTQVMGNTLNNSNWNQGPARNEGAEPQSNGGAPLGQSNVPGFLTGQIGSLGTGALAGGLAGLLFGSKRMRETAGTAIQIGAVAAIGGLAYKAYQNYRQGKPIVPQAITDMLSEGSRQPRDIATTKNSAIEAWIPPGEQSANVSRLLLRSMVAAAASDGHLDGVEYGRIRQHLAVGGFNEEEQLYLSQIIMKPDSVSDLASAATTPELRAEVYAAARIAIDPDSATEREWLNQLSEALTLEPALRAHLDAIGADRKEQAA